MKCIQRMESHPSGERREYKKKRDTKTERWGEKWSLLLLFQASNLEEVFWNSTQQKIRTVNSDGVEAGT